VGDDACGGLEIAAPQGGPERSLQGTPHHLNLPRRNSANLSQGPAKQMINEIGADQTLRRYDAVEVFFAVDAPQV
jgi:hypothetical protein